MVDVEKAIEAIDSAATLLAERYNLYRFEGPVMELLDAAKAALGEAPSEPPGMVESPPVAEVEPEPEPAPPLAQDDAQPRGRRRRP